MMCEIEFGEGSEEISLQQFRVGGGEWVIGFQNRYQPLISNHSGFALDVPIQLPAERFLHPIGKHAHHIVYGAPAV